MASFKRNLPLYHVVSDAEIACTEEPVIYASAASYRAMLESYGVPAHIEWAKTVSHTEWLSRQSAGSRG